MLTHLSIKNYALINDINVSFSEGFTTITGETGAGKSILLGGLALALGKRADLSSLQNDQQKCIIEAEFTVSKYGLHEFFADHDLDYEDETILRREILPSGKSRAFINDSPVTLDILKSLGERLVDVHSQHQTLRLTENDFQLKVVDALANNRERITTYKQELDAYKKLSSELQQLLDFQAGANKEHDYNSFLLKELETVQLKSGIQKELETEQEQLSNVEQIMELLTQGHQLMNGEQVGIAEQVQELKRIFQNLSQYGSTYQNLSERIESVYIELDDIASEIENVEGGVEADPQRLESINGQLQQLYDLQKKHQVSSVEELVEVKSELEKKVDAVENIQSHIHEKQKECSVTEKVLEGMALKIRDARNSVIPQLKSRLQDSLYTLGMPSATFKIEINPAQDFKSNGKDDLSFLFSANKGSSYGELKKVASGGELSRIMLTIKSILAQYEQLPTLMFDEIDTGVSGEISGKMGEIMQEMSKSMQVFSITHLPQVASKGKHQFKVFKSEQDGMDTTQMRQLSEDERIEELAEMLGGKALSDSAMAHARELLKQP
ncbi:DNA repair protein RecN [Flagellimonas meridianipacifica]|uniref:DNA repair protein RecN n=1 Tax=Flagellimonas meridianipacifica TaxID=1080225 RepID=A0A2T0MAI8_9FLAO|nr:DNA repair protein RecN [Allomuricauda pacifica]PRX54511.1 DNA repair protein RecN (Recombination protein N) [Allomuricauda pacifica]